MFKKLLCLKNTFLYQLNYNYLGVIIFFHILSFSLDFFSLWFCSQLYNYIFSLIYLIFFIDVAFEIALQFVAEECASARGQCDGGSVQEAEALPLTRLHLMPVLSDSLNIHQSFFSELISDSFFDAFIRYCLTDSTFILQSQEIDFRVLRVPYLCKGGQTDPYNLEYRGPRVKHFTIYSNLGNLHKIS